MEESSLYLTHYIVCVCVKLFGNKVKTDWASWVPFPADTLRSFTLYYETHCCHLLGTTKPSSQCMTIYFPVNSTSACS
jgi:hypothetical protein